MAPDNLLASKLEHMLRIQLLVNVSNEKSTTQVHRAATEELTLGDLVEMNEKRGGAHKTKAIIAQRRLNREPSTLDEPKALTQAAGYIVCSTMEQTRPS